MPCDGLELVDAYTIELIQGDYASYLYHLTDQNGNVIMDIESVVFTCKRLGIQQELTKLNDTDYQLVFTSDQTSQMKSMSGMTYDITVKFTTSETPITLIYNADIFVLKKENALDGTV